jgi:hypothetical protein
VQPLDDDVITVAPPAIALPIEPVTVPLPAVIVVVMPPAVALPPCDETTVQLPFGPALLPVMTVRLEPPELLTLTELLELVCAEAIVAPRQASAAMSEMPFTTNLPPLAK